MVRLAESGAVVIGARHENFVWSLLKTYAQSAQEFQKLAEPFAAVKSPRMWFLFVAVRAAGFQ